MLALARSRAEQSRARLLSPWINSRLPWRHHRRGAAALLCSCWRWCSLPPPLPRKVRLLSPAFFWSHFEPVCVEFGRNLLKFCTRACFATRCGWISWCVGISVVGIGRGEVCPVSEVCELVCGNVWKQSASFMAVRVRFRPIEGRWRLKSRMVR